MLCFDFIIKSGNIDSEETLNIIIKWLCREFKNPSKNKGFPNCTHKNKQKVQMEVHP